MEIKLKIVYDKERLESAYQKCKEALSEIEEIISNIEVVKDEDE